MAEKKKIIIKRIPGEETHVIINTDTEVEIIPVKLMPFVDIHMHIQSNNCAPLPLQWGILKQQVGKASAFVGDGKGRRHMDETTTSALGEMLVHEFGKIGTMDSFTVANLLMSEVEDKIIIQARYQWTLAPKPDENYDKMKDERNKKSESFYSEAAHYFNNFKILSINVILPMDLEYAHYWGKCGLPIYMPIDGKYYYFNDWLTHTISKTDKDGNTDNQLLQIPYDAKLLDLYNANEEKKQFLCFDLDNFDKKVIAKNLSKTYKHYLKEVPEENGDTYENYRDQIVNTKAAAIRYPFSIIPFYHYDPRRHFNLNADTAAKDLGNHHAFFMYEPVAQTSGGRPIHAYRLKNAEEIIKQALPARPVANKDAFDQILKTDQKSKDRLFWGFKMYTELGYAPDDFTTYPHLDNFYGYCENCSIPITCHCSPHGMTISDTYINLKEAINNQKNEPNPKIQAVWRDRDNKLKSRWRFDKDSFLFFNWDMNDGTGWDGDPFEIIGKSLRYVDELCVNPESWENVLKTYPNLKLNLAHFSGIKTIIGRNEAKDYFPWKDKIITMIKSGEYPNLYSDIAYFALNTVGHCDQGDPDAYLGYKYEYEDFVDNFSKILKNDSNENLKRHLLMGSDWLMTEMTYLGVGTYYHNLFRALKDVSKKVGYDVWYQMTVINNLRFLGILKEDDKTVDDDKLKAYKDNLIANYDDKISPLVSRAQISTKKLDGYKASTKTRYYLLSNRRIKDSPAGKEGEQITSDPEKPLTFYQSKEFKDSTGELRILGPKKK